MLRINFKTTLSLSFLLVIFIFIRSIWFSQHLNFSFDQAWGSTKVLEIWRNKEITLVGPGNSIVANGKQILQGSINYYFHLIFLLLGRFDPVISSYIFMTFAVLMSIPLYYGVKLLSNQRVAFLVTIVYGLFPLYIDFSRFFFSPTFQLTLIPILILFMGLYRKTRKRKYFFLTFFMTGIISQFHFAALAIFLILFIYYLVLFKIERKNITEGILISFVGFLVGFSPVVLFELKNNFYNTRVFIEYLLQARNASNFSLLPHRYLLFLLILIVLVSIKLKKLVTFRRIIIFALILLAIDLFLYLPTPSHGFGMSRNWNYPLEKKAYEIIKQENLENYNVSNLIYDNLAVVIKYHLRLDNVKLQYDDYYHNKYLFVIDKNEESVSKNPAYEIKTFFPRKKLKQWQLNKFYNLYLFERL